MTGASINDTAGFENDRLGDVTFKSFICAGGEVEISDSLACAEESIILPHQQDIKNTETDDTIISDSITLSCCDHVEHPYYSTEIKEVSCFDVDSRCLHEIPSNALDSGDLDNNRAQQNSNLSQTDGCGEVDVTCKSFVCDSGEVEVSEFTMEGENTIPFPKHLDKSLLHECLHSTKFLDYQEFQEEHADHPYQSSVNGGPVSTTLSEDPNGYGRPADNQSEVTFKSFNCTGGEIEISDGTEFADKTVPLSDEHVAASTELYKYEEDPSILAEDCNAQDGKDIFDHLYCNTENDSSNPSGNLSHNQEPLPFSSDAMDEVEMISLVVSDIHTSIDGGFRSGPFRAESEVEKSYSTQLSENTSSLPDDQDVSTPREVNAAPTCVSEEQNQDCEQPSCPVINVEGVGNPHPPFHSSCSNIYLKTLNNESVSCQVQESSKHTVHPEDSALPSVLPKMESSVCSQVVASAGNLTPLEVHQHLEPVSHEHSNSAPPEPSEAKDSALGSTGNGPVLYNTDESPCGENLNDVLKALSECPSVASALQLGLFSPVLRRVSLSAQNCNRNPSLDQFSADDSAFEGEKSFVAPVNPNPAGLWAEHMESPMPRPLFNSTALGYKLQTGPVSEPVKDDVRPCAMEKPVLDIPVIEDGPLQQQLRQMAEFLILACGKMGSASVSSSVPPSANTMAPSTKATTAETHSVCVGTTVVQLVNQSLNTSGQFERKRDFSMVDSCTLTEPLLWK